MQTNSKKKTKLDTRELIVKELIPYTRDIFELRLARDMLDFTPGQYVSIFSNDKKISREYSIASGVSDPDIGFLIKHLPEGIVTEYLMSLEPGQSVLVSEPQGEFRPGLQHGEAEFSFLATGTGIAPFLSYIKSYPEKPPQQFFYGVRQLQDAVGFDTFKNICECYLSISREKISGHSFGRITNLIDKIIIQKNHHYYLCGLDAMIEEMSSYLREQGIRPDHIHHEIFFYSK